VAGTGAPAAAGANGAAVTTQFGDSNNNLTRL